MLNKRTITTDPGYKHQPGERVTRYHGTYVGYIKDNRDVQKNGRLEVWIPELGSKEEDRQGWLVANYASPFGGATSFLDIEKEDIKEYKNTQTSYGFWMIPPDVDNQVLVCFANGDTSRCYWFACVFNTYMNQQIPGIAASESEKHYGPETTTDDCELPTAEYNKHVKDGRPNPTIPDDEKKPVQPYVSEGLKNQGLIFDDVRGLTDSSARRESPSKVFGISTPGPKIPEDEGGRTGTPYFSRQEGLDSEILPINRKGGHQIIFDDNEEHEHIKLRTRSGAEIILDETNGIVYITNKKSTAWMEMSESGHVDIFGEMSISVRSQKDINIRADRDLNIEAGRDISIKSSKDYVEDVNAFLEGYANTQRKELVDVWDDNTKRLYLNDFPDLLAEVNSGDKTLKNAFKEALESQGYPTESRAGNTYGVGQDEPSETSLSSVQKLALIRGSHIVGEGLGDSGNIYIQGIQDVNIAAGDNAAFTADYGKVDFFAGQNIAMTSGLGLDILSGTDIKLTSGLSMNIGSGTKTNISSGGDLGITSLNDTKIHFRGEVQVLLEGLKLDIEAQPVWFKNPPAVGREVYQVQQHVTNIKLHEFNMSAETIKTTVEPWEGSSNYPTVPSYNVTVLPNGGTPGTINFNAGPTGNVSFISGFFNASVLVPSGGQMSNTTVAFAGAANPAIGIPGPTPVPITALPSTATRIYPESGDIPKKGLPWPERATVAASANLAETPQIYAKSHVLPMLKRVGNKEYCLTYHRQVVESIARRLPTHEPCVEHENLGGAEKRNEDIMDNIIFRIID